MGYWLLAAALVASWLVWPQTRALWDVADRVVFYHLNGLLAHGPLQIILAVANNRLADVVVGLIMVGMLVAWVRSTDGEARFERVAAGGIMILFALVVMQAQRLALDVSRLSPSLVLTPVYKLSQLQPWAMPKDSSEGSFPGDHAAVLLMFAWFAVAKMGRVYGRPTTLLAVLFCLPRLFSGAHWFTDIAVGSVAIALVAMPLVLYAPFMRSLQHGVARLLQKITPIGAIIRRL